jgi:GT2 family glycosyltransferase
LVPLSRLIPLVNDAWTRLRYRRAELRRITPTRPLSDALIEPPRWIAPEQAPDGPASILVTPLNGSVTYQLTLPADGRMVARCSLGSPQVGDVEFTIEVSVGEHRLSRSCRVSPGGRSRTVRVDVAAGGTATIVLSARPVSSSATATPAIQARWHNPRVEWRRPIDQLAAALVSAARGRTVMSLGQDGATIDDDRRYRLWVAQQTPSARTLKRQRALGSHQSRLFTLIVLVPDSGPARGSRTLDSLLAQSYRHWEAVVVTSGVDGRPRDPRIRVVEVRRDDTRAGRLNRALAHARGDYAAIVDDLDSLAPNALFELAQAASPSSGIDVFYSDEDTISARGVRARPFFKPEWSPELLLAVNYVGRIAMIGAQAARDAGGYREGFGEACEWELLLRLSRTGARFRRVIGCLYHRHASAAAPDPAEQATVLSDHAKSLGLRADVAGPSPAVRLRWNVDGSPLVSVVIPNRNAYDVLKTCVDGLLDRTAYPKREVIVVDNGSTDPAVLELYARLEREGHGRIVPFDRPFNFSAACNAGAAAARGGLLLFLNNDIEVIEPDWMGELVGWAERPEIGVVGARLLYPDRLIQHAGVVFGLGLVGHIFARADQGTTGVFGSTDWYRNYQAVTGACQMMRRDVFDRLGGFDERLRLSFSDVMLCMEAWKAGYRVVYTPWARLIHHESYTRRKEDSAQDMELFAQYLRAAGFVEDPYLHPELDPRSLIPRARPPFEPRPREVIADCIGQVLAASPRFQGTGTTAR